MGLTNMHRQFKAFKWQNNQVIHVRKIVIENVKSPIPVIVIKLFLCLFQYEVYHYKELIICYSIVSNIYDYIRK